MKKKKQEQQINYLDLIPVKAEGLKWHKDFRDRVILEVKNEGFFTAQQLTTLAIGNIVAFIVAILAIKFFITFVKEKGFKLFGIYRIILGSIVLILIATQVIG